MKAIIFNSGFGKRMGELTKNSHKSMVKLKNGETIFERQLRILSECGIKDFIVTTGPFEEQLIAVAKKTAYKNINIKFVKNDKYDQTNYIYSEYLLKDIIDDDFLVLHGDLVFNKKLVVDLINNENESLGLINKSLPLPEKDFKARVINGKIREVGINIFDDNCYTFQPLYKLSKKDLLTWMNSIVDFIENKKIVSVYAENAFNDVSDSLNIVPMSYENYYINEIDNLEDYQRVSNDIELYDYKEQETYLGENNLIDVIKKYNIKRPLIVTATFMSEYQIFCELKKVCEPVFFYDYTPNPKYEEVVNGVKLFKNQNCDSLISFGGGSSIDVAKSIKYFLPLDNSINYLEQQPIYVNIKHIAIPTTAGTGSEATKFAVIYYNGEKKSLDNDFLLPDVAILEKDYLKTMPKLTKLSSLLDALCQAIEAMWSKNSSYDSRDYSISAIKLILKNYDKYLKDDENTNEAIIRASNLAGRAINIAKTTSAHAMSYKLTSKCGIPHGLAVALCLPHVWKYLSDNYTNTTDPRGASHVRLCLDEINKCFNEQSDDKSIEKFSSIYRGVMAMLDFKNVDSDSLAKVVNIDRLGNFPVKLDVKTIKTMYETIINN